MTENKKKVKLCKMIKERKRMIEVWEEGTTGISVLPNGYDKKALETEVKCIDRDAMDGMDAASDVSELFK